MKLELESWLSRRAVRMAIWTAVVALSVSKFFYLDADFPNWSLWMIDQAKFTDEGWWGSAAVMHALTGQWYVSGDYNPAVALPIWPVLLSVVFHFTGVSVVAARALNVAFSIATLGVVYALVGRYASANSKTTALLSVVLLAASPFAFVFNRLAILETLVVFEFCLAMLVASFASAKKLGTMAALAALVATMLLTKTTAALLIPAVLWVAWSAMGRKLAGLFWAIGAVAVVPLAFVKGYAALVGRLGYGGDYAYFFGVNALPDIDWHQTISTLSDFFQNCFWVDRVLYPVGLLILVLALAWKRKLWSNPLFTASWIVLGAEAVFIFKRQDDYAPRYFLFMLEPLVWIVVLTFGELMSHEPWVKLQIAEKLLSGAEAHPDFCGTNGTTEVETFQIPTHLTGSYAERTALCLLVAMAASVAANVVMIGQFLTHRDYDFSNAANSIRDIIRSHREQKELILGVSGPQISLMTGIPSINDFYGTEDAGEKLERYQPGWYLAWNSVAPENEELLAPYKLEKVASYVAFDDDDRTTLILYKMVRLQVEQDKGLR